mmetsp:Transcript_37123/g.93176  ORF Transcript_37123/g.93176 Transcript_37123/m.93176 type:complete len:371 (-) Transcript_37123:856-1968(-)
MMKQITNERGLEKLSGQSMMRHGLLVELNHNHRDVVVTGEYIGEIAELGRGTGRIFDVAYTLDSGVIPHLVPHAITGQDQKLILIGEFHLAQIRLLGNVRMHVKVTDRPTHRQTAVHAAASTRAVHHHVAALLTNTILLLWIGRLVVETDAQRLASAAEHRAAITSVANVQLLADAQHCHGGGAGVLQARIAVRQLFFEKSVHLEVGLIDRLEYTLRAGGGVAFLQQRLEHWRVVFGSETGRVATSMAVVHAPELHVLAKVAHDRERVLHGGSLADHLGVAHVVDLAENIGLASHQVSQIAFARQTVQHNVTTAVLWSTQNVGRQAIQRIVAKIQLEKVHHFIDVLRNLTFELVMCQRQTLQSWDRNFIW